MTRISAGQVLSGCALVVTGLLLWTEYDRRFGGAEGGTETRAISSSTVEIWPELVRGSSLLQQGTTPDTLLVFVDFECPACRQFARTTLEALRTEWVSRPTVVLRHWPLAYNRFARQYAVAAECASTHGLLREFHDVVFESQDSIGLLPLSEFARRAGMTDSVGFGQCLRGDGPEERVQEGLLLAERLGLVGTPSVVLNGRLYSRPPTSTELRTELAQSRGGR
jgi:protein-disulfide isomerase